MKNQKSLLALIANIDPATVTIPGGKNLQKGWVVVGIMDDNLKRLFGALHASTERLNAINKRLKEKRVAHGKKHAASEICNGDCEKHHDEMKELENQHKAADQECKQFEKLFWASVRLQFPELLDKVTVTLTETFEVAYDDEAQKAAAFLGKFERSGLGELSELLDLAFAASSLDFRR